MNNRITVKELLERVLYLYNKFPDYIIIDPNELLPYNDIDFDVDDERKEVSLITFLP